MGGGGLEEVVVGVFLSARVRGEEEERRGGWRERRGRYVRGKRRRRCSHVGARGGDCRDVNS